MTWRALRASDIPALAALAAKVAAADDTGSPPPEDALAQSFQAPRFTAETDSVGLWSDGELIGAGTVFGRDNPVDGRALIAFDGAIHPGHRGQGWGQGLLDRLEARGRQLAGERLPGVPVRLRTSGGTAGSTIERLLVANGYRPDNYYVTMQADLRQGVTAGSSATVPDDELLLATRDAHNDAFRDHRNYSPMSQDIWTHWVSSPTFRRELSRVVHDDGRVLAYVVTSEYEAGIAHVELVGTRREARGRGLGREVLMAAQAAAYERGYRVSQLEVDSTSLTGADRLYLSAGYHPVRTISRYIRDFEPTG